MIRKLFVYNQYISYWCQNMLVLSYNLKEMTHHCEHNSVAKQEVKHCCGHGHSVPSVCQTLEELDFERGIWFAAQHNDIERVEKLLRQGICPNSEDAAGYCALHYASRGGLYEMCQILLGAGASCNALTRAGKASPLHRAASQGHEKIVNLLVKNGALLELQDADGKTALHRAVENGHLSVAYFLLDKCENLKSIKDFRGKLPLDYAGSDEKLKLSLQ